MVLGPAPQAASPAVACSSTRSYRQAMGVLVQDASRVQPGLALEPGSIISFALSRTSPVGTATSAVGAPQASTDTLLLPNLLIIGAPMCGTTSLHEYLRLHPEISMSARKELKLFTTADWRDNVVPRLLSRPIDSTLSPSTRGLLVEALRPEVDRLRKFTGKAFSGWSSFSIKRAQEEVRIPAPPR